MKDEGLGDAMDRETWQRKTACCDSTPACPTCPMVPENRHRSLKELAEAALLGD